MLVTKTKIRERRSCKFGTVNDFNEVFPCVGTERTTEEVTSGRGGEYMEEGVTKYFPCGNLGESK